VISACLVAMTATQHAEIAQKTANHIAM